MIHNTNVYQNVIKIIILGVIFAGLVFASGCEMPSQDASLEETAKALAIQATVNAYEGQSPQEAVEAENTQPDPSAEQTAIAQSVQATLNAAQPEPTATTESQQPDLDPPVTETESLAPSVDFEEWMKSANILLYEDMVSVYTISRYVSEALNRMGLNYVDVGDAMGYYKEQLLSGGPGGAEWDLIISAKEARGDVQGEFYVYLNDALNAGSSVIIEEWQLDKIGLGKISTILGRCGVKYQDNWAYDPIDWRLLWPVDQTSPIHHQPNEGVALTNPIDYWPSSDLGDFMRLGPGSDAVPLWTARANETNNYLTAVSCLDGQLIIQTYSTHNYGYDRVIKMWENYIYNTLYTRYLRLQN